MKDEFVKEIGVWGQRHYSYLKKNKPTVINVMRMNGTLEEYLQNINNDAQDMFDKLMKQMAETEGITEKLKATDQMTWVCKMENIHNRAIEIVNKELIFV